MFIFGACAWARDGGGRGAGLSWTHEGGPKEKSLGTTGLQQQ